MENLETKIWIQIRQFIQNWIELSSGSIEDQSNKQINYSASFLQLLLQIDCIIKDRFWPSEFSLYKFEMGKSIQSSKLDDFCEETSAVAGEERGHMFYRNAILPF